MTTRLITPPAALAVDLAHAKECLRVDGDDLDASISSMIRGITVAAEHETNRAFIHQVWRVTLDAFPDAIRLDRAPTAEVLSLRYYDSANVLRTLHPADYELDNVSEPGYVVPAVGRAWPSTYPRVNAVMVEYRAGYGASHEAVPANVQEYVLGMLCLTFDPPMNGADAVRANFARMLDESRVYG